MNPYAPPAHDEQPAFGRPEQYAIVREGRSLVIPVTGAAFPPRCVRCNRPAATRLQGALYWHSPWLYGLVFLCFVAYLAVVLLVNKKAAFEYWLCGEHAERRRRGLLLGWLGIPTALLVLFFVPAWWKLGAFALLVGIAAAAIVLSTAVSARRIDRQRAWLKVGQAFLDSFPEGPSATPLR
jgi:hypothetical protein